jgi:hypothetical protein
MILMNNKPFDTNRANIMLSWLSIFVEAWLILLKRMPVDKVSVFFFCFFILVAISSWLGTVVEERQKNPNVSKPHITKGETK